MEMNRAEKRPTDSAQGIRILFVEDELIDLEVTLRELKKSHLEFTYQHVFSFEAFQEALRKDRFDVIIADYNVLGFTGMDCFEEARAQKLDVPFILLTGHLRDDTAVECVQRGISAYVTKDRIAHLPVVIIRVLEEKQLKAEKEFALEALKERVAHAAVLADTGQALTRKNDLSFTLQECTEALVRHLPLALARIWVYNRDSDCLDLKASSGPFIGQLQNFARIEMGQYAVGRIALTREGYISNDLPNDPYIGNQNNAIQEGVVSFAGFPLVVDRRLMGVIAVFGLSPIGSTLPQALTAVSNEIALGLDKKEAEENLRRSEAYKSAIFNSSLDGIITVDDCGQIIDFNPAAERMFGCVRSEVIGQLLEETIIPLKSRTTNHQGFHRYLTTHKETLLGKRIELTAQKKNGVLFPIELSIIELHNTRPNLFTAFVRDITDRKKTELDLFESEQRFRQLAENIQEVFWLKKVDTAKVIYISPAYQKIWGKTCSSLYMDPDSWLECVHTDDRERMAQAVARQANGDYDEEFRIIRTDGEVRWIRDRAFPVIDDTGKVTRVAGIAEDITSRKQLEAQFLHAQKMESVGRLAGGVAHDFNNLLTAIGSFARMAQDAIPPGHPARNDLDMVLKSTDRASNLTRQLLGFARKQAVNPQLIDPSALLRDLEKLIGRLIKENIEVVVKIEENLGVVRIDPTQLEQVLINLAVNANDAMPDGGKLVLEASFEEVRDVSPSTYFPVPPGDYIVLSVVDTGQGMSEEVQQRIFEPFFTTKEQGKGTGLGLATVYGIVKQNNGYIALLSKLAEGTRFKIYLPRLLSQIIAQSVVENPAPVHGEGTVLLVEDQPQVRSLVFRILKNSGYRVIEAENGVEALKLVERMPDTHI
ncbi:MAG: hypothetical protein JWM04_2663, partial [Verrucomicrobiales bacterium]|nr:hypothetical protein [Verrucomicrobiales bacterium]